MNLPAGADTFYGVAPTGLIELQEYRYPVSLYVPQNYKPDRNYPLIITIPEEGESPSEHIKYWTSWAKKRSMLVLSPSNLRPEDTPYAMDDWILGMKEDIQQRYRIDPSRIFLTGRGGGAHYAAYLATNHPEEFSAAALFEDAWSGRYERLLELKKRPVKQVPFLIVVPAEMEQKAVDIEQSALEYEKRGYLVTLMKVEDREQMNTDAFKEKVLEWLNEKSDAWLRQIEESQKAWTEKTRTWFENFFRVN